MMPGKAINFEELKLQGFGPYQEPTTFTFTQGTNVYIAVNESGKTSMMAGLLATIFGLSHRRRSIAAFNLERFRNWHQPAACRGDLILSAGGERYQIQRDFDTHQVSLWLLEEEQKKLLVEGPHNPEARKPLNRYVEALHRILGISSQELFEDTFYVAQPLPEADQISSELQGLLAGAKGASFQNALDRLLANLKNLTKYTGPNHRGITARNMAKNGTIELKTAEIQNLKERISADQQAADSLLEVRIMTDEIERELMKAREEWEQKNKVRQAWSDWKLMASQYTAAAQERVGIRAAVTEVNKLKKQLQSVENELRAAATDEKGAAITTIDKVLTALAEDTEKAQQAFKAAEQKILAWQERQREHHTKFTDLTELTAQALTAARYKWQLLEKQRELEKQLREMGIRQKAPLGVRLAGGGMFAAVTLFFLGKDNLVLLMMGIMLAFLIGVIGIGFLHEKLKISNTNYRTWQHELKAIQEQVTVYDRQLGSFAQADEMELARLIERLKNYEQEECRLKTLGDEIAAIDLPELEKQWHDKKKTEACFQKKIRLKEEACTKLETLLNTYQVDDIEQLIFKYQRSEDLVAGRMLKWQEHVAKYPGLPGPECANDPQLVQQTINELNADMQKIGDKIVHLETQRTELLRQMARLEGVNPINIASAEVELQELKEEQGRLEQQADALTLAYQELGAAIAEYSQTYQQRLEEKATSYFQKISGVKERRIVLDDQLNLGVIENGRIIATEYLSKGARDQMYLSLRFAIADLLADDVKLPLIFDDPFTGSDTERLARIRKILTEQSAERQFFILAHAEHYTDWGEAIVIKRPQ